MDGRTKHRLIRRVLIVCVVACAGLVAAAPIAMADPCPPLDLGCTLESTTTTVGARGHHDDRGEVLEDTTTTAGEVLEDTTTTAGEVLEDTTTTAGEVLEETTTTVGGVLEGGAGPIVGGVLPPDGPEVLPGTGDQPLGRRLRPPADQPAPAGWRLARRR